MKSNTYRNSLNEDEDEDVDYESIPSQNSTMIQAVQRKVRYNYICLVSLPIVQMMLIATYICMQNALGTWDRD